MDVTDALKQHVSAKFEKIERHFDHVTNVHVILAVEKKRQIAEATVHISGAELFANAENENMYAAIDALSAKLDKQIIRHKEKGSKHR